MKKILKKLFTITLSFILILGSSITLCACSNREEVLRLYVPGEYITDEILSGFEDWYFNVTGKNITVNKKEFDTNETMYTMVAVKRQDYDVICPSDYMAERMRNEGLLLKINDDIMHNGYTDINNETYLSVEENLLGENNENETLINLVKTFDSNLDYVSPYMWGTMGIMYYYDGDQNDSEKVKQYDLAKSSWTKLFDVTEKKIYMKDSERDTFTVAMFYYYYDEMKQASNNFTDFETEEYQALLYEIYNHGEDFDTKLNGAKEILKNQKPYVYDYETDEGKDDLLTTKGAQGYYGMFWSCDAGYIMADWSGDDVVYNTEFRYIVPTEGSNIWIDCFCIPKYAKNKTAADLFILYMSNPDVAFDCMDYTGCTSAVYQTTVDYYEYLYPQAFRDGTISLDDFYEMYDALDDNNTTNPTKTNREFLFDIALIDEEDELTFEPVFAETSNAFKAMYLSLMFPNLDITVGDFTFNSPLNKCGVMRDLGTKANDDLLIMWAKLRREITF